MPNASKAKMQYITKWKAENVRTFKFECNKTEDADVIAWLDDLTEQKISKAAYLKSLIRKDMRR